MTIGLILYIKSIFFLFFFLFFFFYCTIYKNAHNEKLKFYLIA